MQVSERVEGHYEIQDEPFGKAYAWRPGHLVIECYCGEVLTITYSVSICECGADHASTFREELCAGRGWGMKLFTPGAIPEMSKTPGCLVERALDKELVSCLPAEILLAPAFLPAQDR